MTATDKSFHLSHVFDGVFLYKDVAEILCLDPKKVRRWITNFWDNSLAHDTKYSFGSKGSKAVNFYTLIEFYTFYKLREEGFSAQYIQKIHQLISKELDTPYPFAKAGIEHDRPVEGVSLKKRKIWYKEVEHIVCANGRRQLAFKRIIEPFLKKIEFDHEGQLPQRFFPLEDSRNVVVDPKHQFGQPTVTGTNIKTQTLYNLFLGGESYNDISTMYGIAPKKVKDAIGYHQRAA
jgi:uncharacterized protein (DUF433 family)